jgi:glycosyltransferase involved in cell wall biosynthesis
MVYTGIFYPPIRVVTPLLAALKRLSTKNGISTRWFFHYYGDNDSHVRVETAKLGIADRVRIHGKVPRSDALSAVKGAHLAVVIASVFPAGSPETNGWIPAKLYEAIGLGTPVLLIAPPGSDAETIAEPTRLVRRFAGDEIDGVAEFIAHLLAAEKMKQDDVQSVTWKYLGDQFDHVLRQLLIRTPSPAAG